jgi:hypothetical protein
MNNAVGDEGATVAGGASSSPGAGQSDSTQNYEQLAQEIEALDTYWGPTFRSVHE